MAAKKRRKREPKSLSPDAPDAEFMREQMAKIAAEHAPVSSPYDAIYAVAARIATAELNR